MALSKHTSLLIFADYLQPFIMITLSLFWELPLDWPQVGQGLLTAGCFGSWVDMKILMLVPAQGPELWPTCPAVLCWCSTPINILNQLCEQISQRIGGGITSKPYANHSNHSQHPSAAKCSTLTTAYTSSGAPLNHCIIPLEPKESIHVPEHHSCNQRKKNQEGCLESMIIPWKDFVAAATDTFLFNTNYSHIL